MYEAKARGRNGHQFYRAELNAHASERQALESSLRHAIERKELSLHYQPILDLATGTTSGTEALVRWQHPHLGPISAAQLVAIAEDSGLIIPIGHWVLSEACRQAVDWRRAGVACGRMAVNISAVELRSPGFTENVARILADTGLDPRHLELELTETFLMQDVRSTRLVLAALRQLGISIALDDFGTGYSSLSYMRRFPIDTLKIDRSFVRDLTTDTADAGVVRAIVNMGLSLNMRVVAEGVESPEQLAFLVHHGCLEAQGFHFSRPLEATACGAFLAAVPEYVAPAVPEQAQLWHPSSG
jgi:EAL domain-containing protein (putative c-di-GMP-specific phosphodiesterase class I)